jgi:tRNA threonylcarbamoyladenosine biosynthesis protein TsaB
MKVLGLDSSTASATCAIIEDDNLLGEITFNQKKQHSVILMAMIDSLLTNLNLSIDDMDGFVVSKGPGSFTGLRIGLATIKGLSQGTRKPFASVSSLDALAYNMAYTDGILCPILDALRDNVYTCIYSFEKGSLTPLTDSMAVNITDLLEMLKKYESPVCFIGDGISIFKDKILEELPDARFAPPSLNLVKASSLAELGLSVIKSGAADDLYSSSPEYLRKSQAEREYDKKMEQIKNE